VRWLEKDLGPSPEPPEELQVPLSVTALSQQALRAAIASGLGEDICGSIRILEQLTGVSVRGSGTTHIKPSRTGMPPKPAMPPLRTRWVYHGHGRPL